MRRASFAALLFIVFLSFAVLLVCRLSGARPAIKTAPALKTAHLNPLAQMPLPGAGITSAFGVRRHPIYGRAIFHEGLDFAACCGQPINCVLDGVVQFAGRRGGFGNVIYIYHPVIGTTTVYGHLSSLKVVRGQSVRQGAVIGFAGSTGLSTGPHLHFGVKSSQGKWIDPRPFLSQVPYYEFAAIRDRWQPAFAQMPHANGATRLVAAGARTASKNVRSVSCAALLAVKSARSSTVPQISLDPAAADLPPSAVGTTYGVQVDTPRSVSSKLLALHGAEDKLRENFSIN